MSRDPQRSSNSGGSLEQSWQHTGRPEGGEATVPRTQKERNEETRRVLLDAGSTLLREVGYARTSVAQITRRANRAHGTFYLHFENKRDLVSVLLDEMADEARR